MRELYADIIVDISHENLDHTFSYRIPSHLSDEVVIGSRVLIPFGAGNRRIRGHGSTAGPIQTKRGICK